LYFLAFFLGQQVGQIIKLTGDGDIAQGDFFGHFNLDRRKVENALDAAVDEFVGNVLGGGGRSGDDADTDFFLPDAFFNGAGNRVQGASSEKVKDRYLKELAAFVDQGNRNCDRSLLGEFQSITNEVGQIGFHHLSNRGIDPIVSNQSRFLSIKYTSESSIIKSKRTLSI
jgi:hypothetical protein